MPTQEQIQDQLQQFTRAREQAIALCGRMQLPPPVFTPTPSNGRKRSNSRKRQLGCFNPSIQSYEIQVHMAAQVETQREHHTVAHTVFHELGHYFDSALFHQALGKTYWLQFLQKSMGVVWQLGTENANGNVPEEDFADSVALYMQAPSPMEAMGRIGSQRANLISAMIQYRQGGEMWKAPTWRAGDTYRVDNYQPLLKYMAAAVGIVY